MEYKKGDSAKNMYNTKSQNEVSLYEVISKLSIKIHLAQKQKYSLRYEKNENFIINIFDQYLSKKCNSSFFNFKNTLIKKRKRK